MQSAKKEKSKATLLLTLPMDQFEYVQDRVDAGKAISRGEYIRNLILHDMEKNNPAVKA
jgi:hypothetical protein